MKKILSIFLLVSVFASFVYAEDFDASVDSVIRKEYLENPNLPPLPTQSPVSSSSKINNKENGIKSSASDVNVYKASGKVYTIKRGTKVTLVSKSQISDWMKEGHIVSFSASNPFHTKDGNIIPSGTIFKGRITDSHRPQIGANGGLVELCIDEIYFNGIPSKIDTKISLANSKRIFRNDIKGKHTYWKNFYKVLIPGRKVYNATSDCAGVLLPIPVINILSIIPWTVGVVVYTVNFVASPFITIFTKGGSLSLPQGTYFEIKFTDDSVIRG